MNTLEKVARAMCIADGNDPDEVTGKRGECFLEAYAKEAKAAIDAMQEWQPIESAPKDGTCVIVYPPTFDGLVSCAKWDEDKQAKRPRPYWRRMDALGSVTRSRDNPPTHWMPLPEPPK